MTNTFSHQNKAALISVYDKRGIIPLAESLYDMGYVVLASGGTYSALHAHFVASHTHTSDFLIPISDYTQSPEILHGRVKTLHPKIHGGILAQRDNKEDCEDMKSQKLLAIDLVVVNLYPFEDTIQKKNTTLDTAIEQIDIGGVTLLRAAAKNYKHVIALTDPKDYAAGITLLQATQTNDKEIQDACAYYKQRFASKVFSCTAYYEGLIAKYVETKTDTHAPKNLDIPIAPSVYKSIPLQHKQDLRYGENPHQNAQVYTEHWPPSLSSVIGAKQIHGKALSFNNIRDAEAAVTIVKSLIDISSKTKKIVAVGIKHNNPCGVAMADTIDKAWARCYLADTISIFGGIVAFNSEINEKTAKSLSKIFLEIIIAPKFSKEALVILKKKKNIRLLVLPLRKKDFQTSQQYLSVTGGMLVQDLDTYHIKARDLTVVTKKKPSELIMKELLFAWNVCKHVKSNAIVLSKNYTTTGVGAGQMNRVGAALLALEQAKELNKAKGSVLASDAFFPMGDTVELAAQYGIKAIIQPGGSIKDQASIDMCNTHGIAMVFTGIRHFLH